MKRKRFILILTFILINVFIVLGFAAKKFLSATSSANVDAVILVSSGCAAEETNMLLQVTGPLPSSYSITWEYGDGKPSETSTSFSTKHTYTSVGTFTVRATVNYNFDGIWVSDTEDIVIENCDNDLSENCCDGSFAPIPGKKYMISAWVKEPRVNSSSPQNAYLTLAFGYINSLTKKIQGPLKAKGQLIDGWQRIEETFTVPADAETISVRMNNQGDNDDVFFDDIRIYPFDGNLKSYVYDPESKRLVAEMDQNNYATVYEYDDEGQMIRVKKETERGMMTISESRSGQVKHSN